MVEVKRKKGESFESFLRRFSRRLLQSGKIIQFKKIRYHKKAPSRNLVRASALVKIENRAKREYLKKIGRLVEEDYGHGRKKR
jgi:ribosomal protein S21